MPTYPIPGRRGPRRGPWPRVIILVIILVFVIVMAELGLSPEAAAGIGAATLAAACSAYGDRPDSPPEGLPDAEA